MFDLKDFIWDAEFKHWKKIESISDDSFNLLIDEVGREISIDEVEKIKTTYRLYKSRAELIKDYVSSEFINLYKAQNNIKKKLSREDFKKVIKIESVYLNLDGKIEIYINDNDLFDGKVIFVEIDNEGNFDRIELQ